MAELLSLKVYLFTFPFKTVCNSQAEQPLQGGPGVGPEHAVEKEENLSRIIIKTNPYLGPCLQIH